MDPDFWHQRWKENRIGFHQEDFNPLLVRHLPKLNLPAKATVFVPLCGKTKDIHYLRSLDYEVMGCELSQMAVEHFFEEAGLSPKKTEQGKLTLFESQGIKIFAGNVFDLTEEDLGKIDCIFDRAAFIALPLEIRGKYSQHLISITNRAPQILIGFEYDQSKQPGPPFSIGQNEVNAQYEDIYQIEMMEEICVPGGLKGICPAQEKVWLLK